MKNKIIVLLIIIIIFLFFINFSSFGIDYIVVPNTQFDIPLKDKQSILLPKTIPEKPASGDNKTVTINSYSDGTVNYTDPSSKTLTEFPITGLTADFPKTLNKTSCITQYDADRRGYSTTATLATDVCGSNATHPTRCTLTKSYPTGVSKDGYTYTCSKTST